MIAEKKEFFSGLVLFVGFLAVLIIVFSPVFRGRNALEYLDSLYNSISKGSAYYIPAAKKEGDRFRGTKVIVTLNLGDPKQVEETVSLFRGDGAEAVADGGRLTVSGDLGRILENSLADADAMYKNEGSTLSGKYGYDERKVLYNWWKALTAMDRELKKQKKFKQAEVVTLVKKKAVEPSYNYYEVKPQKVAARLGTIVFSLFFYVIYTIWYGFAIMFMFEGWGLRLGH